MPLLNDYKTYEQACREITDGAVRGIIDNAADNFDSLCVPDTGENREILERLVNEARKLVNFEFLASDVIWKYVEAHKGEFSLEKERSGMTTDDAVDKAADIIMRKAGEWLEAHGLNDTPENREKLDRTLRNSTLDEQLVECAKGILEDIAENLVWVFEKKDDETKTRKRRNETCLSMC